MNKTLIMTIAVGAISAFLGQFLYAKYAASTVKAV